MPAPRLCYADQYAIPLPEGHKFPMEKYRLVRDALAADGVYEFVSAPLATPEQLLRVHDPEYVRRVMEGGLSTQEIRRIGFPWSPGLVLRTLASVGGTLLAARDALQHGVGGNLAGGTHHAFADAGSGFCVMNDIAVAIRDLQADGLIRKAAIVDCDVHQGDGTAKLFEGDDSVFTLSLHGRNNFPFRKQVSRMDIEFADGVGDEEYLARLRPALETALAFQPDIVFFQSGVDCLAEDTLGKLNLSEYGLMQRDEMVLGSCRSIGVPVVITLGGGYAKPIAPTVQAHANTFRTAARLFSSS